MRYLIMLVAVTALFGCKPQEHILRTWLGAPEDKLVSIWGAPTETYTTEEGAQVLVYSKPAKSDADLDVILPASGRSSIVDTCETTFIIDAGRVVSYTSDDSC